jgi:hypothetical protein
LSSPPEAHLPPCCPLPVSLPQGSVNAEGRRIYIHEGSLAHLAGRNAASAELVYSAVARIAILKAIHHQVSLDGVLLGIISEKGAASILLTFEAEWSRSATDFLRSIGYRPDEREHRDDFRPLLEVQESVVATCYFSSYYTFATGQQTADRMYQDESSMKEVRRKKREGTDYQDLTLINSRWLAQVDTVVGFGPSKASYYFSRAASSRRLPAEESRRIRMEVLGAIRESSREILRQWQSGTEKERAYASERIDQSLGIVFARGILKTV